MALITVQCANCLSQLRVPEASLGKRAACTMCTARIIVGGGMADPPPPSPGFPAPAPREPVVTPPPPPPRLREGVSGGFIALGLVCLAVIAGSFAGIQKFRSAAAAPPTYGYHACISIESYGVRLIALDLDEAQKDSWQPLKCTKEDFEVDPDSQASFDKTMEAVKRYVKICREHDIPDKNISIVCNSGITAKLDGKSMDGGRAKLNKAVNQACNIAPDYLSAEQETRFGALGTLPRSECRSAIFIDLSSSSAKFGYYSVEMKFDSVKLTGVKSSWEKGPKDPNTLSNFRARHKLTPMQGMEGLRWLNVEDPFAAEVRSRPAFQNRSNYHLIGGGAWVVAATMHPVETMRPETETREYRIPITPNDIVGYNKLVSAEGQDKAGVMKAARANIPYGSEHDKEREAIQELEDNKNITFDYMVSAGQHLLAYSNVANFPAKKVQFYRLAQHAWPTGYILSRNGLEN